MKKVERITVYCKRCNKIRNILPKLLLKGRGKYCSVSCARKDHPPTWMHKNYEGRGEKIGNALRGRFQEEESWRWKGDDISYRGLHLWIEKNKGKANKCTINSSHKATRYHWANISREYKRELDDWIMLCPKCHFNFDRKGLVIFH